MAEQPQSNVSAAAFPSPPPFYQYFTIENVNRIAAFRAAQQTGSSTASPGVLASQSQVSSNAALRLLDLPPELRFLHPPEPPAEGIYRSFGDMFNLNEGLPSLVDQGIAQLYTPPGTPDASGSGSHSDRALILKRIAKSLLLNFLELIGLMSVNPLQYSEKVQDIRTLFINFHHLLNEYRPHQARESLIMMMEDQLERSKNEIEGIERMKMKIEGIFSGLEPPKMATEDEGREASDPTQGNYEDDEIIWEELINEFS